MFENNIRSLMSNFVPQDDLLSLKVGSVLHHLSIKRAIQVLRLNNYEPNCLRRSATVYHQQQHQDLLLSNAYLLQYASYQDMLMIAYVRDKLMLLNVFFTYFTLFS